MVARDHAGDVWLWTMNGTTVAARVVRGDGDGHGVSSRRDGDYDGDGMADVLWHHATRGEVWVWLMNGPAHPVGDVDQPRCATWGIRCRREGRDSRDQLASP